MITIIDYNAGNLMSLQNALKKNGEKSVVTKNPMDILRAEKIILPGVGAAGAAMDNLRRSDLVDPIRIYAKSGRPCLGICLGAQLLLDYSEEDDAECLGIISGKSKKFSGRSASVPQMGWNQVESMKKNILFDGIPENSYFYFLNSYYLAPKDKETVIGRTFYEKGFASAINLKNVYGVQFHPEKSASLGLKLINNFINLC